MNAKRGVVKLCSFLFVIISDFSNMLCAYSCSDVTFVLYKGITNHLLTYIY